MTRKTRRIIFFIFLIAFAASAPAVLLSTAGYRLNWKKGRLQKTGVLQVRSTPKDAQVAINGERMSDTTPSTFVRLLPEDYDVTVRKDGYLPWKKTVTIRGGETITINDITLFKDALPRLMMRAAVLGGAWSPNGAGVAAFVERSGGAALIATDGADGIPEDANSLPALVTLPLDAAMTYDAAWSPDGRRVLATAITENDAKAWLVDTASGNITALSDIVPGKSIIAKERALRIAWSEDGSWIVFAVPHLIGAIDAQSLMAQTMLAEQAAYGGAGAPVFVDAIISGNSLFAIETSARGAHLLEKNLANAGAQAHDTGAILDFVAGGFAFADRDFIGIASGGDLRLLNRGAEISAPVFAEYRGATSATREDDGKKRLLLWDASQLAIIDPASGAISLLARVSNGIQKAFFLPDGLHAIMAASNEITAVDIGGGIDPVVLAKIDAIRSVILNDEKTALRFIGTVGRQRGFFEREL